jgi:hypothetical protein
MKYLIYDTEEEAIARADQEGQRIGYAFWKVGSGTKWATAPQLTADGKYALQSDYKYQLTEEEEAAQVEDPAFPSEEI